MKTLGNGSEAAEKGNGMPGIIRKGIESKLQRAIVHSHLEDYSRKLEKFGEKQGWFKVGKELHAKSNWNVGLFITGDS